MNKPKSRKISPFIPRIISTLIPIAIFLYVSPSNPIIISLMILATTLAIYLWTTLLFSPLYGAIAAAYISLVLGFSIIGLLDVVNIVLIHTLLALILLIIKRKHISSST
ncbi:MAG: hypothetical protein ACMG6E_01085 [Candidatus Roizmanbacteria bacterium]